MDINNKRIVITGASSGIGKDLLTILSKYEDVKIVAVARNTSSIENVDSIIYPFSADLSTKEGVDSLFDYCKETLGGIDLFIANAGFAYMEKIDSPDWTHIENIFALNIFSPIYSLEKFVKQNTSNNLHFVSILSGVALVALPHYALYSSTKAALHQFISSYRYEKIKNLCITSVYPVATQTDFFDKASGKDQTPLPWPMQTSRVVAEKIVKGIEANKKEVFPSLIFRLFYPIGRAFPFLLKIYQQAEQRKTLKSLQ